MGVLVVLTDVVVVVGTRTAAGMGRFLDSTIADRRS